MSLGRVARPRAALRARHIGERHEEVSICIRVNLVRPESNVDVQYGRSLMVGKRKGGVGGRDRSQVDVPDEGTRKGKEKEIIRQRDHQC